MVPFRHHVIGNVVDRDLRVRGLERDDADLRGTHDAERGLQLWVFGDGVLNGDAGADDGVAGIDVAAAADGEEGCPATRDERAGPGAGHSWGAVDAAGPVRGDEILVRAEFGGAVEDDTVAFGCEAIFVRVDRDGGYAGLAEVEASSLVVRGWKAGGGEEGEEEGAEAAVDVEGDLIFGGDAGDGGDVVDNACGVIWAGCNDENGVWIDVSTDRGGGDSVFGCGTVHDV